MAPARKIDWQTIRILSQKTSLKPATCYDLLHKGWIFVEDLEDGSGWIAPINSLKENHGEHSGGAPSPS